MYRVLCPACREGSSASRAGPQRGGERQLSLASLSVRPGAPCTSVQAGSSCIKKHAARRARARGGGQAAERGDALFLPLTRDDAALDAAACALASTCSCEPDPRQVPRPVQEERRPPVAVDAAVRRVDRPAARLLAHRGPDCARDPVQVPAVPVRPLSSPSHGGRALADPHLPPRRLLQPEYTALAKQWNSARKGDDEDHFFAYVDFANGPEVFQRVRPSPRPTSFLSSGAELTQRSLVPRSSASRPRRRSSCTCRPRVRARRASWAPTPSTLAGRAWTFPRPTAHLLRARRC